MSICKVFIPYGALGTGIAEEAFAAGMALGPDILSCDAGSTDSGPYYLGTGRGKYARKSVKHDLRMMVTAAHKAGIPITIGSAQTCGADSGVDELSDICREICAEEGIGAKLTKIYSEQCAETLKEKYAAGKVKPLQAAPQITEAVFDECTHVVALAGAEPFIKALEDGADIVICGRATDTAVIAAMPLLKGCGEAAAWHGAKTCECGSVCTTIPTDGGVFLTVEDDSFTVQATGVGSTCTPYTISAHLLYENADPFRLVEPGVVVDASEATYRQLEDGRVLVENSKIKHAAQYTMKLEGSSAAGFQTVILVGIRDREVMKAPMAWIKNLSAYMEKRLVKLGFDLNDFHYSIRPYGWNAVYGGAVPEGYVPNELGVLFVATASTQEVATQVAKAFNPFLLHFPVDPTKQMPSFAFPFSPSEIERGQIYEFRLNHVVEVNDPLELVRFSSETLGNGKEGA